MQPHTNRRSRISSSFSKHSFGRGFQTKIFFLIEKLRCCRLYADFTTRYTISMATYGIGETQVAAVCLTLYSRIQRTGGVFRPRNSLRVLCEDQYKTFWISLAFSRHSTQGIPSCLNWYRAAITFFALSLDLISWKAANEVMWSIHINETISQCSQDVIHDSW